MTKQQQQQKNQTKKKKKKKKDKALKLKELLSTNQLMPNHCQTPRGLTPTHPSPCLLPSMFHAIWYVTPLESAGVSCPVFAPSKFLCTPSLLNQWAVTG